MTICKLIGVKWVAIRFMLKEKAIFVTIIVQQIDCIISKNVTTIAIIMY